MARRSFIIGAVLLLGIGGALAWRLLPVRRTFYTDADTIKAPRAAAAVRQILWQPPRPLPDVINTSGEDYEPRIAADGMTLLFVRRKAGDNADVYYSRRHAGGWSEPMALTGVNSESDDLGPVLSHDGRSIYFYSNRPGSIGGYDLWVAHRRTGQSFEFDEPVNLGPGVNSPFNEYGPALTPHGDILYFSSNRPRPEDDDQPSPHAWSATLREDLYQRTYDLYVSVIGERGAGAARPLSHLNTAFNEGAPAVSPVGDFLYFASDRSGGEGGFDLYRSRRRHGTHEAAHNLGKTVNSTANDLDPSLGTSGYALYFSSDRFADTAVPASDEPRAYNLYQTESREVFVDSESLARSPMNWSALWSALWPNLLWLLIALTLAALLLTLLRQTEEKRLSLLMRCLLGSVLAHLVLVMVLTIWGVSSSIAGEFSRRGKIQVSLASATGGESVLSQITGGLTSVEVPTFDAPSPARADAPSPPPEQAGQARLDVQHQEIPEAVTPQATMTMTDATVAWSPQVDRSEPPAVLEPAPVDVPVTTPNESSRMSVREFHQARTPIEPTADAAQRPAVVTTAQATPSVTVAPTPSDALDAQPVMRQRLVEQVPAPGAKPAPEAPRGPPVNPTANHLPPTPGIQLAVATVEKLPEVSEFQLDPSERTVQVPALRVSDLAETDALDDAQASLAPELTADATALDGGLDGQAWTQVSDAAPNTELVPVDVASLALPIPDGAAPDVSTPRESTPAPEAREVETSFAAVPTPQAVRAAIALPALDRVAPNIDQLAPDRSDATGVEESMAAQLQAHSADRSLPELAMGEVPVAPLDAIPASASPNVSIPVDAQQVAETSEPIEPVTSPVDLKALRPDEALVDAVRTVAGMGDFHPDEFKTTVADTLMATTVADVTADANLPEMPIASPTTPAPVSALPELALIRLPAVAQAEPVYTSERRSPVTVVDLVDVRATTDSWISRSVREAYTPELTSVVTPRYVTVSPHDVSLVTDESEPDLVAPVIPASYEAMTPIELPDTLELLTRDIELATEESAPENAFVQRQAPNRLDMVKRMGGSAETEGAVALALKWLAEHQDDDGYWDIRVYDERCGGCDETKPINANVALTGLATLCFLGSGHTHHAEGPYREHVARAIDWLLDQQSDNGDLRGKETMYTQGIASIALAEALTMTGDQRLREPVEVAMRFIYAARNRHEGGWRYDPGQAGDTSVLGWMMMAMKSASTSGLPVPRDAFEAGGDWLGRVSDPNRPGLYKYRPERDATPSMTAEAMFIQQLLGKTSSDPVMPASAQYIIEHLPDWDEDPNTYFWYYASLALFQHQGSAWTTWNEALKRELLEHQRRDGQASGSWDPQGNEWSELGGRVYQTALCTLMLEVYYRYLPMYANEDPTIPERPADAVGTIAGVVRDADTGQALAGASVRLDVPGGQPIMGKTDRDGFYYLWAPELPPFFALSASHAGYVPESENVNSTELHESVLDVDFALHSDQGEVLVTEAMPEVHHLGDNRFEGRINSQFQKEAEGAEYGSEFVLTPKHLTRRFRRAEVRMKVKGVQRAHSLFINGTLLDTKLDKAPSDGSFGEFRARFDLQLLRPGSNTIDLVAKPSTSDIDDFEFVNVQIHLLP